MTSRPALAPAQRESDLTPDRAGGKVLTTIGVNRLVDRLSVIVVLLGSALRIRQYSSGRSLWNDEAALALNVVQRGYGRLLEPLDLAQGAPIGFLWAQRTAITWFGNNEAALRLFPLLTGIAAVVLFAALARRLLSPWAALSGLVLFATLPSLVYYSAEAKQYSTDVAATLLVVLVTARLLDEPRSRGRAAAWGAATAAAVLFSHPVVFVVAASTVVVTGCLLLRGGRALLAFVPALVAWPVAVLVNYVVSLRHLAGDALLESAWRDGFAPRPLQLTSTVSWAGGALAALVPDPLGLTRPLLVLVLVVAGVVGLLLRRTAVALVLLAVGGAAFVAALADLYPLKWRLALYLVPLVLLLLAAAIDIVASKGGGVVVRAVAAAALAVLAVGPVREAAAAVRRPYTRTEIRTVMAYVAAERQPGDGIYVHWTAAVAFGYYAPRLGLNPDGFISYLAEPGGCRLEAVGEKMRQHQRFWVVFGFPPGYDPDDDIEVSLANLDRVGRRVDRVVAPGDTEAHLYAPGPGTVEGSEAPVPHPGTCLTVGPAELPVADGRQR